MSNSTTPAVKEEDFFFSIEATVIATTAGIISAFSSTLVIFIILRSHSKLSSAYHQVIFVMSSFDVISSLGIVLTSIPMPIDVIYPFPIKSYGNTTSCNIQGLCIICGQAIVLCSNVILSVYYLCTIRFNVSEEILKKRVIPVLSIISIMIVLSFTIISLSLGMINPRPYEPYCYFGTYPEYCHATNQYDCLNRNVSASTEQKVQIIYIILVGGLGLGGTLLCLVLVVVTVFSREKQMRFLRERREERLTPESKNEPVDNVNGQSQSAREIYDTRVAPFTSSTIEIMRSSRTSTASEENNLNFNDLEETRFALYVAIMYIMAFLLTWIWTIISVTLGSVVKVVIFWKTIDYCKMILSPLQGLFNALIFIFNKIYVLRKSKVDHIPLGAAFRTVIRQPKQVPELLLSRISLVHQDQRREERRKEQEAEISRQIDLEIQNAESFPSDFFSNATPSLAFSNALLSYEERSSDNNKGALASMLKDTPQPPQENNTPSLQRQSLTSYGLISKSDSIYEKDQNHLDGISFGSVSSDT